MSYCALFPERSPSVIFGPPPQTAWTARLGGRFLKCKNRPGLDLGQLASNVLAQLRRLADAVGDEWEDYPDFFRKKLIADLEAAGRAFGHALFDDTGPSFLQTLVDRGADTVSTAMVPSCQTWPLEFARVTVAGEERYLGELFLFAHDVLSEDNLLGEVVAPQGGQLLISYAEDDALASACESHAVSQRSADVEELAVLVEVAGTLQQLIILQPLIDGDAAARNHLHDWLSTCGTIIHFNSHTFTLEQAMKIDQKLGVRAGSRIGVEEMRGSGEHDFTGRLVLLNACGSAERAPNFDNSLSYYFFCNNAEVVIGTAAAVADGFATRFVRELYRQLVVGMLPVAEALRATQRIFLSESDHPMALVYRIIGNSNFRLVTA